MSGDAERPAPEADAGVDGRDGGTDEAARWMRRAITEIRREGWKVAVIYAVADAALITLFSNLVLSVVEPSFLPARVPVPAPAADLLRLAGGWGTTDPSVATGAVVGVALGVATFGVEVALRVRRPLVEQFEAANPALRESLRTARDAVEGGRRSRMVFRLYEEVVDELGRSSSVGLLDLRRLSATLLVVATLSLATIPLATVDLSLGGVGEGDGDPSAPGSDDYGGLQDPDAILGDPEDVAPGGEDLDAVIDTSGSGSGDGSDADSAAAYDDSGFAGADAVESQQAGFAEGERLEDAELIREYNLAIREGSEE